MPPATPHTAARRTRSQSPPILVQRIPMSTTAAAMASSSISPYMWIVNGPTSTVLVSGDGIDATSQVIWAGILPIAGRECVIHEPLCLNRASEGGVDARTSCVVRGSGGQARGGRGELPRSGEED